MQSRARMRIEHHLCDNEQYTRIVNSASSVHHPLLRHIHVATEQPCRCDSHLGFRARTGECVSQCAYCRGACVVAGAHAGGAPAFALLTLHYSVVHYSVVHCHVDVRQPCDQRERGALAADVVCLDEGRKHGEAGLRVEGALVAVLVHARDLDLVAGPRDVDEVVQQDDVLAARQPPGRHAARCLLHAPPHRCVYCSVARASRMTMRVHQVA